MQNKNLIPKFSYGVIPQVAEKLNISYKAAQQRIRNGNVEAIRIAIEIEKQRKKELEKAMSQYASL